LLKKTPQRKRLGKKEEKKPLYHFSGLGGGKKKRRFAIIWEREGKVKKKEED